MPDLPLRPGPTNQQSEIHSVLEHPNPISLRVGISIEA
jgi:hypothetical protein